MKSLFSLLLLIISLSLSFGQGKLLLVGGGSERDEAWAWSNVPYQWAVDQSQNKRVAIIAFGASSDPDWLPNYFISLGAADAKNFIINTLDSAQKQNTYDVLMSFDVLFFKGGDQAEYYTTYKDTNVSAAMADKFAEGGVIGGTSAGMAILSDPMYTAVTGTLYSDEALEDVYDDKIELKDDFTTFLPGYLVDTHFVERGRFPRLITFLTNWYLQNDEAIGGIGVDDRTAFCIDENSIGTAFGTGAVNIFNSETFAEVDDKPASDNISVTQLLHGNSYNLNTKEVTHNYTVDISNDETFTGNYSLYLSGSSVFNQNAQLLDSLKEVVKNNMVIITDNSSQANPYVNFFNDNNIETTLIASFLEDSCSDVANRNAIKLTNSYLFLITDLNQFLESMANSYTGSVLKENLTKNDAQIIMLGESIKLAGNKWVTNNLSDGLNSYYGALEYADGLNLLTNAILVPDAFSTSTTDYFENNASSIPYALVNFKLKYGVLINQSSWVQIRPTNAVNMINSFGRFSAILITNTANQGGLANQQVNSDGNVRNVAGFDEMKIAMLHNNAQVLGQSIEAPDLIQEVELAPPFNLTTADNELSWAYSSAAPDAFIIERKLADGAFEVIEELEGTTLTYVDESLESDILATYRIQAGKEEIFSCYSEERQVRIITGLDQEKFTKTSVFPNPVLDGKLHFKGTIAENNEIIIFNSLGNKIILAHNLSKLYIDVSNLISGIYILQMTTFNGVEKMKFIVDKH